MKTKTKKNKSVYIVYRQQSIGNYNVIRAFSTRYKAKKFCDRKNDIYKPEFDDYGYCDGIYHNFSRMKIE